MSSCSRPVQPQHARCFGFTLPEVLVVVGVIAILIAVVLPALRGGLDTAQVAKSRSRLRQIHHWMTNYSSEHRDYIVPSRFNYQTAATTYPVKVRSSDCLPNEWRYRGTWTDILWTYADLGATQALVDPNDSTCIDKYRFDSPDHAVYEAEASYDGNPFRSAALNQKNMVVGNNLGSGAKPFGTGAAESGMPGYFAANNFFNADPDMPGYQTSWTTAKWWVNGQIRFPERSMYLVDSFAGETIDPIEEAYFNFDPANPNPAQQTCEVDFRYHQSCLMMFMDGHSEIQNLFYDLDDLEKNRRVRVRKLDERNP